MLPAWLTIELALIPVVLAAVAGIIAVAKMGVAIKYHRHEIIERDVKSINANLHRLMGALDVEPVD